MEIENNIISAVANAIKALYGHDIAPETIQLQKTKKEFAGHLTLVVFPFLKISRKKPEDTAQEIGDYLKKEIPSVVADFNVVKGFLNLVISPASWIGLLSGIQRDEKFGLAAAEAMAAGKPVFASRVEGLAQVVADERLLFDAGKSDDLVKKILTLCRNSGMTAELGQLCSRRAERFDISHTAEAYLELYREVIKES